jgi:hypothetical protein
MDNPLHLNHFLAIFKKDSIVFWELGNPIGNRTINENVF